MLNNERGEANYFSTVVFIFIAVLLLAFIIDLFSIISTKQELDHAADQMVKQIQLSGGVNGETDELFEFLSSQIEGAENISYSIQAAKETSVKIRYCHIMTPLRFIVDWNSLLPIHPPVISGIIVCGLDLKDRCGAIRQFHKVVHISQHPRILWVLEHLFDLVDPISGFPLEYLCYQRLQQMPHFHGNPVALIIFH